LKSAPAAIKKVSLLCAVKAGLEGTRYTPAAKQWVEPAASPLIVLVIVDQPVEVVKLSVHVAYAAEAK